MTPRGGAPSEKASGLELKNYISFFYNAFYFFFTSASFPFTVENRLTLLTNFPVISWSFSKHAKIELQFVVRIQCNARVYTLATSLFSAPLKLKHRIVDVNKYCTVDDDRRTIYRYLF
jgi:hypothetical protein